MSDDTDMLSPERIAEAREEFEREAGMGFMSDPTVRTLRAALALAERVATAQRYSPETYSNMARTFIGMTAHPKGEYFRVRDIERGEG